MLKLFILISLFFVPGYAHGTTILEQEEVSKEESPGIGYILSALQFNLNLYAGAEDGDIISVKNALQNGANPNFVLQTVVPNNENVLMIAIMNGHTEVVKLLLDNGANPNSQDDLGYTSLMIATMNDRLEAVKLLLEAGGNVNTQTKNDETALEIAKDLRYTDIVSLLKEAGATE